MHQAYIIQVYRNQYKMYYFNFLLLVKSTQVFWGLYEKAIKRTDEKKMKMQHGNRINVVK